MIISILFFILGAAIGSFLNVCIIRMPHERSIVTPSSHCLYCKTPIKWYDNIPLISYIALKGRCRSCGEKFSFQYFFVELVTAATFLCFYLYYGLYILLLPYLIMASCFIVAIFVDFQHRIIPDEISVGGMCIGLVLSLFIPQMFIRGHVEMPVILVHLKSFGLSLLGVLVGGGCIYLMGILGDWLFKKESIGGGDIKLLAMIGAFLGWERAILAFFIGSFFGAIYGIFEKIRTNDTTIAYGPFLALGSLIALFYGDNIIVWILNGYGFKYF